MDFLTTHNYAPSMGQQVVNLQASVGHVPSFTMLATPAFHAAYPAVQNQTLTNLITVYERVYRGQYVNTTAAQHHLAMNQAIGIHKTSELEDTMHNPEHAVINGIMASARGALAGEQVTHNQLMDLQAQVAKTITRVLHPSQRQTGVRDSSRSKEPTSRGVKNVNIPKGACPLHPHAVKPHTWEQCSRNPENK
jgi:hypothetical protein